LRELVYWSLTYNSQIYMQPYRNVGRAVALWFIAQPVAMVSSVLALAVALTRPVAMLHERSAAGIIQAYARAGFEVTAALVGLTMLLAAALPLRFWPHYFLPVYPFFGIALGVVLELLVRRTDGGLTWARQAPLAAALVALLSSACVQRLVVLRQQRIHGGWLSPRPDPICAHIDRYSRAGEPIFIWGFDGDLYVTCRRPPASRYVYLTMVAGVVPPFWNQPHPARVAPGTRQILLRDLEESRPAVIVDVPIDGFAMSAVPELAALLDREYCALPGVTGNRGRAPRFYGRKDRDLCDAKPGIQ
jgi:hypothetical protein